MPLESSKVIRSGVKQLEQLQRSYLRGVINKDASSILLDVESLLSNGGVNQMSGLPMKQAFATEAYKLLHTKGVAKESDWYSSYNLFSLLGFSLGNLLFAVNVATDEVELVTTSVSIINMFATKNLIVEKDSQAGLFAEVQAIRDMTSTGSRIQLGFKENALFAIRLEPIVIGNSIKFKLTVPKQRYSLSSYVFVPYPTYVTCGQELGVLASNNLLRIRTTKESVTEVYDVTRSETILQGLYSELRVSTMLKWGSDPILRDFYMPVYGASETDFGVVNIRLETVDSVQVINPSMSDVSLVKIDTTNVYAYFEHCVNNMSVQQVRSMTDLYPPVSVLGEQEVKSKLLKYFGNESTISNLYRYMLSRKDLFDMSKLSSFTSSTDATVVDIPSTPQEFESMLRKGAYKVTVRNQNGVSTYVVTLDESELKRNYGGNYLATYESIGVRIRACLKELELIPASKFNEDFLLYLLKEYNLFEVDGASTSTSLDELRHCLNVRLEKANAYVNNRAKNEDCVTVRQLNADVRGYYKQINIKNVVEITRVGLLDFGSGSQGESTVANNSYSITSSISNVGTGICSENELHIFTVELDKMLTNEGSKYNNLIKSVLLDWKARLGTNNKVSVLLSVTGNHLPQDKQVYNTELAKYLNGQSTSHDIVFQAGLKHQRAGEALKTYLLDILVALTFVSDSKPQETKKYNFTVTVYDSFSNTELKGDFIATDKESAVNQAKEFYAVELDTVKDSVQVRGVEQSQPKGIPSKFTGEIKSLGNGEAHFVSKARTMKELYDETVRLKNEGKRLSSYIVYNKITLSHSAYIDFIENFISKNHDFIVANKLPDNMPYEVNNVVKCLLVKGVGHKGGVLVNCEGYDYARTTALYISKDAGKKK